MRLEVRRGPQVGEPRLVPSWSQQLAEDEKDGSTDQDPGYGPGTRRSRDERYREVRLGDANDTKGRQEKRSSVQRGPLSELYGDEKRDADEHGQPTPPFACHPPGQQAGGDAGKDGASGDDRKQA